jgi:hypothetical protein
VSCWAQGEAQKRAHSAQILELLEAAVLSGGFDNSIPRVFWWIVAREQLIKRIGCELVVCGTVPTIVPETRQNSVSRAYASQLARSVKWKRVKDLRGKMKMVERRISV